MKRVLVIGRGDIGISYDMELPQDTYVYSHCRAFYQNDYFNLVAGVDTDDRFHLNLKEQYKAKPFFSIKEAMEEEKPNLVVVSVPTEIHLDTILNILEYDCLEAILCEKPISESLETSSKIVEACSSRNIPLFINFFRKSDLSYLEITHLMESTFLPPYKGFAWYSKGFLHNGSHIINLLSQWLGPVEDVQLYKSEKISQFDRIFEGMVIFQDGEICFLSTEDQYTTHSIELISSSGRLIYDNGGKDIFFQPALQDAKLKQYRTLSNEKMPIRNNLEKYQLNVVNELEKFFNNKKYSLCGGNEALSNQADINKILHL